MVTTIKVHGMSCNHCVSSVKKALEKVDGVHTVQVDLKKGEAGIEHDRPLNVGLVKNAIERAGFEFG